MPRRPRQGAPERMRATGQQNVMVTSALDDDAEWFPRHPPFKAVIVAAHSWSKRPERRMTVHTKDAGADLRRSTWMAAAQAGDRAAYQALLRDCVPLIKSRRAAGSGVPPDRPRRRCGARRVADHPSRPPHLRPRPARSRPGCAPSPSAAPSISSASVRRHGRARGARAARLRRPCPIEAADPARGARAMPKPPAASPQCDRGRCLPRQREAVEAHGARGAVRLTDAAAADAAAPRARSRSTCTARSRRFATASSPERRPMSTIAMIPNFPRTNAFDPRPRRRSGAGAPPARRRALRALAWLGAVAAVAPRHRCFRRRASDLSALAHRLGGAPDMWLARSIGFDGDRDPRRRRRFSSSACPTRRRSMGAGCRCPPRCYGSERAASAACATGLCLIHTRPTCPRRATASS